MKYIIILSFVLQASCVEQISFPVERVPGIVVIDGSLTNEEGPQILRIGETAASPRVPIPLENAKARIYDEQGSWEDYVADQERPGTYLLMGEKIKGEVGESYYLEVEHPNGKIYRSKPEAMQAQQAKLDSIYYDFSIEKESNGLGIVFENTYINAYIDVDLSQADTTFFMKWDVEEVFLLTPTDFPDPFGFIPPPCYVYVYTSDIDLNLFNGFKNEVERLEGLKVGSQVINWHFREKHYFTVRQKSMNQEAYEYWENARDLLSNTGNIFDIPPAPLPGNLYNPEDPDEEVLGYFDISSSSLLRFRTFRDDIPIDQILECTYSPSKRFDAYPDYCLDCLSVRNSTHTRPDFF
ncbi:MAG: DUF4249 domain-containing protein [Bacteroidota bacterium]